MSATHEPIALRQLFEQAALLDVAGRAELLSRVRLVQPDIADEVEGMLRHHVRDDAMLDRSPLQAAGLSVVDGRPTSGGALDYEREHGMFAEGAIVGGYTIRRVLGAGGSSIVYEATRDSDATATPIALKLIRPELATEAMVRRFDEAGATLRELRHPAIAACVAVGNLDLGGSAMGWGGHRPFVATELVCGTTAPVYANAVALSTRDKLALVAALCDAADHAHRHGVHHLRLSASHVLIGQPGAAAKIIDLAWATLTSGEAASATPLARRSHASHETPAQTDIYALGEIMYELLAGHRPRPMVGAAQLPGLSRMPVEPIGRANPSIAPGLEAIVMCALAPDPARRYARAREMAADVQRLLALPAFIDPRQAALVHRRRTRRVAVLVGAMVVVGLCVRLGWEWARSSPRVVIAPVEGSEAIGPDQGSGQTQPAK